MLDKIERLEKPTQANDSMDIRLEPDVVSGNDVLTVTDLSKSFDTQTLFTNVDFEIKRGNVLLSLEIMVPERPLFKDHQWHYPC